MTAGKGTAPSETSPALHRFIVFTGVCAFFLLIAGALVTSNDAGLAVPDWPLSYGSLLPPMTGGILFEHGHRMVAGFVSLLTVVLALWAWLREPRRWVRRFAAAALALIVVQAVLGGITVLFYLPAAISTAHAAAAQLYFCAIVALALFTARWWQSPLPALDDAVPPSLRAIASATAGVIFLQLVLGAAFRHNGFGILPHVFGAGVVTAMVAWTVTIVFCRFRGVSPLRRAAKLLAGLLLAQLALGIAAYWAVLYQQQLPQPYPLPVAITVAHVVTGALTLATAVWLSLVAFRLFAPEGRFAAQPAYPPLAQPAAQESREAGRAAPVRLS
ncbi:MAG TPA: COX15/CtaA family protein [Candidatus Acidoferrales bacterium]|nr:COX15/CtaA family protein [Candidatus Acidoferrales bacterium]